VDGEQAEYREDCVEVELGASQCSTSRIALIAPRTAEGWYGPKQPLHYSPLGKTNVSWTGTIEDLRRPSRPKQHRDFHRGGRPHPRGAGPYLQKIITRIMRWLTKQGFLIEEQDRTYLAEADWESALLPLQAAPAPTASRSGHERGRRC
jgi:hypothetical protein